MEILKMAKYIDHTVFNQMATWEDIDDACKQAIRHKVASVCVPAQFISEVKEKYGKKVKVSVVIGFFAGYDKDKKLAEVKKAIKDGADEVDVSISLDDLQSGHSGLVEAEVRKLKKAVGKKVLKVKIATWALDEEEKAYICKAVKKAKADYIEIDKGVSDYDYTVDDIKLFKKYAGEELKIKVNAGMESTLELSEYIDAGCDRIGLRTTANLMDKLEIVKTMN